jgi:hypothetical protein
MSGAYPAPGCFHVTARGTNLADVIAAGKETPRDALEVIDYSKDGRLKVDNLQVWKYDPPELEMKHNDLWANATGGAGGWGDPIERQPEMVVEDLNLEMIEESFARGLYGVVANKNADGVWVLNSKETEKRRAEIRSERLEKSMPAKEWWLKQRQKVLDKSFIEPVSDMYRGSMSFPKFDREYRGFWKLPTDFQF